MRADEAVQVPPDHHAGEAAHKQTGENDGGEPGTVNPVVSPLSAVRLHVGGHVPWNTTWMGGWVD